MLTQTSHLATATATSRVEMVEVSRDSFTHLLSTRPLLRERVMRRSRLRYTASWRAIGANSVFATFSMAQARHARCPQPPTAPPHPDQPPIAPDLPSSLRPPTTRLTPQPD